MLNKIKKMAIVALGLSFMAAIPVYAYVAQEKDAALSHGFFNGNFIPDFLKDKENKPVIATSGDNNKEGNASDAGYRRGLSSKLMSPEEIKNQPLIINATKIIKKEFTVFPGKNVEIVLPQKKDIVWVADCNKEIFDLMSTYSNNRNRIIFRFKAKKLGRTFVYLDAFDESEEPKLVVSSKIFIVNVKEEQ